MGGSDFDPCHYGCIPFYEWPGMQVGMDKEAGLSNGEGMPCQDYGWHTLHAGACRASTKKNLEGHIGQELKCSGALNAA